MGGQEVFPVADRLVVTFFVHKADVFVANLLYHHSFFVEKWTRSHAAAAPTQSINNNNADAMTAPKSLAIGILPWVAFS